MKVIPTVRTYIFCCFCGEHQCLIRGRWTRNYSQCLFNKPNSEIQPLHCSPKRTIEIMFKNNFGRFMFSKMNLVNPVSAKGYWYPNEGREWSIKKSTREGIRSCKVATFDSIHWWCPAGVRKEGWYSSLRACYPSRPAGTLHTSVGSQSPDTNLGAVKLSALASPRGCSPLSSL